MRQACEGPGTREVPTQCLVTEMVIIGLPFGRAK